MFLELRARTGGSNGMGNGFFTLKGGVVDYYYF